MDLSLLAGNYRLTMGDFFDVAGADLTNAAAPEPASVLLLAGGALLAVARGHRRR